MGVDNNIRYKVNFVVSKNPVELSGVNVADIEFNGSVDTICDESGVVKVISENC